MGDEERQLCLQAGATDYIPKPVDTSELLRAIGKWLPAVPAPASAARDVEVVPAEAGDSAVAESELVG